MVSFAFVHFSWDPEVQRKELHEKLKTEYLEEFKKLQAAELSLLENRLGRTSLKVTQMYVSQKARMKVSRAREAQAVDKALEEAQEFLSLLQRYKQYLQEEINMREDEDQRRAAALLKDSQSGVASQRMSGSASRPFISFSTRNGEALFMEPTRIVTYEGESAIVPQSEIRRKAYEPEIYPPTECHVTKFLVEEWLHAALLKAQRLPMASFEDLEWSLDWVW